MTRRLIPTLVALALLALIAPAGAPWTCEASVVRRSLGPAPPVEPITANKDQADCATQTAGGAPPPGLPGGATGSLLFRFRTRVRHTAANPRLFRTFTLPQYVDIG